MFLFAANVDPTRRYLYVQLLGGRAFLDHLTDPPSSGGPAGEGGGDAAARGAGGGESLSTLTVHLAFRGQRFRSRAVPCACEPDIQEGFLLEVHSNTAGE